MFCYCKTYPFLSYYYAKFLVHVKVSVTIYMYEPAKEFHISDMLIIWLASTISIHIHSCYTKGVVSSYTLYNLDGDCVIGSRV